jgi:hypothetical protein
MCASLTPAPNGGSLDTMPVLHLSGPVLSAALERVIEGSEAHGGIEQVVRALTLKSRLFASAMAHPEDLDVQTFRDICPFMLTVRRRVGPYLQGAKFRDLRDAVVELFAGREDTAGTDARIAHFCARFPRDRAHRWVRDLAAELLHYAEIERYPLMCRWVWDAKANTGVLREIWHDDNVDHLVIDVADGYATFVMLRQELSQFLSDNGVFRDVPFYVDLLCAQVYGQYIAAQGGSYLRADFSQPEDPTHHTRRLLGLDGVDARTGKSRLKTIDGAAEAVATPQRLA